MQLKKGDIIFYIKKQAVQNKKQVYKILSKTLKKEKKMSVVIKRANKSLSLFYRILPYKNKKKLLLAKIEKLSSPQQILTQKKIQKNTKKPLVPEKYKPYMQRAYVSSLNSFVYKKPDFDSLKLYPLSIGKQILISKKIFRPPHNFGSFYKVFLFKEKKVIGYISEAEVISEFKKEGIGFKFNPSYKLAKKYVQSNKILDLNSIEEIKNSHQKRKKQKQKQQSSKNRKYVGLSAGSMFYDISAGSPKENWFIGFKLSGYNLLISYLNMDINLTSSYNWRKFYLDILTGYPVLKSSHYHLLAMGGLMLNLNLDRNLKMNQESVDYGLAGALSLLVPLNHNITFKLEAKTGYQIRKQKFPLGFSTSLQVAF